MFTWDAAADDTQKATGPTYFDILQEQHPVAKGVESALRCKRLIEQYDCATFTADKQAATATGMARAVMRKTALGFERGVWICTWVRRGQGMYSPLHPKDLECKSLVVLLRPKRQPGNRHLQQSNESALTEASGLFLKVHNTKQSQQASK